MPGWSLWLVPPNDSLIATQLSKLITSTVPSMLPQLGNMPNFFPHITLTSQIAHDSIKDHPQQWLDELKLLANEHVHVRFESLESEDKFFKRLIIRCEKDAGLVTLAVQCRTQGIESGDEEKANKWVEAYDPHCSLAYSDNQVTEDMLKTMERRLGGIRLVKSRTEVLETQEREEEAGIGWQGGRLWLVPTERPIGQWKPVAEREI